MVLQTAHVNIVDCLIRHGCRLPNALRLQAFVVRNATKPGPTAVFTFALRNHYKLQTKRSYVLNSNSIFLIRFFATTAGRVRLQHQQACP